jgi:hypothetical protein
MGLAGNNSPKPPEMEDRSSSKSEISSLLEKISLLDNLPDFDETIAKIEKERKERAISNISKQFYPMYISQIKTIVLPDKLVNGNEDCKELFVALAGKLGLAIKVYDQPELKLGDLPKSNLEFLRGIIHGVWGDDPIALHNKKSDFEEGRTLVRAAQLVGSFAAAGMSDLLWRNHRYFSNNPGEVSMDNKTPVVPLKERLKGCFRSHESELADLTYTLLKKSYHLVKDDELSKLRLKCTMTYGAYVNLHYKQRRTTSKVGRRKQNLEVSKIPQRPSSNSMLKREELKLILEFHSNTFTDPYFVKSHKEWVSLLWNSDKDVILKRVQHQMEARTSFLQNLGSLTTKRLNKVRKFLNSPSKRKADITPLELVSYLESRKVPLEEFLQEVISLRTPEVSAWQRRALAIDTDFNLGVLSPEQKLLLKTYLAEHLRDDEFYQKSLEEEVKSYNERTKLITDSPPAREKFSDIVTSSSTPYAVLDEEESKSSRSTVKMTTLKSARAKR